MLGVNESVDDGKPGGLRELTVLGEVGGVVLEKLRAGESE
jgi:hypothetical protein